MSPSRTDASALSSIEFQVMLVLAQGSSYGYGIMKLIEEQSGGRMSPEIGSLYRLLGRLMKKGLVEEEAPPEDAPVNHRGLPRKYYRLTPDGLLTVRREAEHLAQLVDVARRRDLLPG